MDMHMGPGESGRRFASGLGIAMGVVGVSRLKDRSVVGPISPAVTKGVSSSSWSENSPL